MSWLWHWIEIHTGTVNESGPYYGFWSGFGSDLGEVAIIGAVIGGYKKVNCHVKRCPRFSHHEYEMEGVKYRLCRKHHPGVKSVSVESLERHFTLHPRRKVKS